MVGLGGAHQPPAGRRGPRCLPAADLRPGLLRGRAHRRPGDPVLPPAPPRAPATSAATKLLYASSAMAGAGAGIVRRAYGIARIARRERWGDRVHRRLPRRARGPRVGAAPARAAVRVHARLLLAPRAGHSSSRPPRRRGRRRRAAGGRRALPAAGLPLAVPRGHPHVGTDEVGGYLAAPAARSSSTRRADAFVSEYGWRHSCGLVVDDADSASLVDAPRLWPETTPCARLMTNAAARQPAAPVVSVLTPLYNSAPYIDTTLGTSIERAIRHRRSSASSRFGARRSSWHGSSTRESTPRSSTSSTAICWGSLRAGRERSPRIMRDPGQAQIPF